jgi:hypothetical protein
MMLTAGRMTISIYRHHRPSRIGVHAAASALGPCGAVVFRGRTGKRGTLALRARLIARQSRGRLRCPHGLRRRFRFLGVGGSRILLGLHLVLLLLDLAIGTMPMVDILAFRPSFLLPNLIGAKADFFRPFDLAFSSPSLGS